MTDETVIGVIPAARIKTGLSSSKTYTLVFTDRRLLLPEMTKQLVIPGVRARPPLTPDRVPRPASP